MLGEAILWGVVVGALLVYTLTLWIPAPVRARWKARVERLRRRARPGSPRTPSG